MTDLSPFGVAQGYLGQSESNNPQDMLNKFLSGGSGLTDAQYAWCSRFVKSAASKAGVDTTGATDMARSWMNVGQPVKTPSQGDVAVFSRGNPNGSLGHVGFYSGTNPDGSIKILAGNQSDAVGYGSMPSSRLLGYRHLGPALSPPASDTTQTNVAENGAISGGQPATAALPGRMALGGPVPPDTQPPQQGSPSMPTPGGLFGSIGDSLNGALSNPGVQFGLAMAGAGGEGKGIGGGLAAGGQGAASGYKYAQMQRELASQKQRDSFIASLSDPNNPISQNFSPETIAILKGLPPDQSSGILASLLGHKGDTEQATKIAQIQSDAQIRTKNEELKYQRDYDRENTARVLQMLQQQYHGAGGGPTGGPAIPGQIPKPQSAAEVQSLTPGTVWQAPDGSFRTR